MANLPLSHGTNRMLQRVEDRASLIGVPLALRDLARLTYRKRMWLDFRCHGARTGLVVTVHLVCFLLGGTSAKRNCPEKL